MKIVEYRLNSRRTPADILDGGYWPLGDTMIGVADDGTSWPALTITALENRLAGLHAANPMQHQNDDRDLTASEARQVAADFWTEKVGITKPVLDQRVNAERDRRIAQGVSVTVGAQTVPVDTRGSQDQSNINGLVTAAQVRIGAGDSAPFNFRGSDDQTYSLTPAEMVEAGMAALAHYTAHYEAAWAHKAAIAALSTSAEIESYSLDGGWP